MRSGSSTFVDPIAAINAAAGDFYGLHSAYLARGEAHAGIILVPQQRYSIGEQLRRLLRLVVTVPTDAMKDRVEFLSAWEPVR